MPRVRPLEIKALVPLLEQDWETPEDLATALIQQLDQTRADRKSYIAVMQYGGQGQPGQVWYVGLGPYAGSASARNAASKHPGAGMATAIAVVPVTSEAGFDLLLREVG